MAATATVKTTTKSAFSAPAFITIEGADGSGKSTLLSHIERHLKKAKTPCLFTREPGGTPIGEDIRKILLKVPKSSKEKMASLTELFLYEAARAEHVSKIIQPALQAGRHVICDRYIHSTLAYQGSGRGLDKEMIHTLNEIATTGLQPNAVVWLKLNPQEAQKRLKKRKGAKSRLDLEKMKFHQTIFNAFLEMAENDPKFIVLDASQSQDAIFEALITNPLWKELLP